jgi:tRNA pseudouridine38-40 synthase
MPTYRLDLEYIGTRYAGWQIQPGLPTVQGEVQDRLRRILADPDLRLAGAARTDAGVHARGQVASFSTVRERDPVRLRSALNRLLPPDIGVLDAAAALEGFHARRSATARVYRYQVAEGEYLSPFLAPFAHHVRSPLDAAAMAEAAARLAGEHDFSSFRAAGDVSSTPVKTLLRSEVARAGGVVVYVVEGTSFLQHMVRTIAGTLVEVGRGRRPPAWIDEVLGARDRARAGPTLPAHGLCLETVRYAPPARGAGPA